MYGVTIATRRASSAASPESRAPADEITGASEPSARRARVMSSSALQWNPGPWAMIATRQAVATTSGRASASSVAARTAWAFMACSCSGVTCCMRARAAWKTNRSSGIACSRAASIRGSSVSIVRLELGTIMPMWWSVIGPPRDASPESVSPPLSTISSSSR